MIFAIISLLFVGLVIRELLNLFKGEKLNGPYLAMVTLLALLFGWKPFLDWRFERFLTDIVRELSGNARADVTCSYLNTNFNIGRANPDEGKVLMHPKWCRHLKGYLDHPQRPSKRELWALDTLTHEAMHVRGERNEHKTECQAIQRNYRTALLLGVKDEIARQNAIDFYNDYYPLHPYFDDKCHPGGPWDEKLPDSTWAL